MKTVISIAIVSIIMSIEVNYHTTFYHIYDSIYKVSVGQHMLNLSIYVLFVTNTTTTQFCMGFNNSLVLKGDIL